MKRIIFILLVLSLLVFTGCGSPTGDTVKENQYICDYNNYNCDDFNSHAEAQIVYELCGGVSNDIHYLDGDKDGLACETLP